MAVELSLSYNIATFIRNNNFKRFLLIGRFKENHTSIGGSVVEFSPATREARVQFPANACFPFNKWNEQLQLLKKKLIILLEWLKTQLTFEN